MFGNGCVACHKKIKCTSEIATAPCGYILLTCQGTSSGRRGHHLVIHVFWGALYETAFGMSGHGACTGNTWSLRDWSYCSPYKKFPNFLDLVKDWMHRAKSLRTAGRGIIQYNSVCPPWAYLTGLLGHLKQQRGAIVWWLMNLGGNFVSPLGMSAAHNKG